MNQSETSLLKEWMKAEGLVGEPILPASYSVLDELASVGKTLARLLSLGALRAKRQPAQIIELSADEPAATERVA